MPEFEINDFKGIQAGTLKPQKNAAYTLRNFDLRGLSGVLEQRYGYGRKYDRLPAGASLSAISYHNFENFYIPGIGGGQEITIQVGIGTITSETLTESQFTDVMPLIWASHIWDGSKWESRTHTSYDWNWLNEMVCTRLYAVDPAAAGDNFKIAVDIEEDGRAAANYFNGWYIANLTEGKVYRIVDSYIWNDGVNDRIAFELDAEAIYWNPATNGRLYIMKNYIPIEALQAMGQATRNDITFLKIRDELRIAFGAKEDRIALAVSYQKSFLNIKEFDVNAYSSGLIDAYCETDGLVITPYSLLTEDITGSMVPTGSGALDADTYYGRITGVLVSGDEILILDTIQVKTSTPQNIAFNATILSPTINRRLKSLKFYYSSDTLLKVFYLLGESILQSDSRESSFSVNNEAGIEIIHASTQIHDPSNANAASILTTGDANATTGWTSSLGGLTSVSVAGTPSDYALNLAIPIGSVTKSIQYGQSGIANLKSETWYDYSIYLKRETGTDFDAVDIYFLGGKFGNWDYGIPDTIFFTGSWVQYAGKIKSPKSIPGGVATSLFLKFYKKVGGHVTSAEAVRIDVFGIVEADASLLSSTTEPEAEMSVEMGYTPSRNLIRSWDWGLVTAGRTFVSNVFIEKLYTNKIFFSPIGGDGNVMYDVLTAGNYYDVENFDGNDVRKIELLANADFLLLQSLAAQRLDPDTGRLASVGLATGIIQPHGSVNFGDRVMFPGKYDVLVTNGLAVDNASKYTIRPHYRDLADADIAKMHAAADPFEKAYSLYSGKTSTKAEFILTESGWIERRMALEPQRYAVNREGSFEFLSSGYIYSIGKSGTDDNGTDITSLWQSVIIDSAMLGEGIPENQIFVITDFFVSFLSNGDLTFKLYLMDKLLTVTHETRTIAKTTTTGKIKHILPLKKEATCSRFQLELGYTGDAGPSECSIFSVGVIFNLLQRRTHA